MARPKRSVVADAQAVETQRLNVQVTSDAYERLLIHCIKAKKSPGQMVTELINANLREWKVQSNTSNRGMGRDRLDLGAEATESAAA